MGGQTRAERRARAQLDTRTKKQILKHKRRMAILRHALLSFFTLLLILGGGLYLLLREAFLGPSGTFSGKLAATLMETSAMKFVPRLFFTDAQIDEILLSNSVVAPQAETNLAMITVAKPETDGEPSDAAEKDIEIVPLTGATYKGFLMIVRDPSRVSVGTCADSFSAAPGLQVGAIAERYGAVGAINAGGFADPNGTGNGGTPLGLVISNGKCLYDGITEEAQSTFIGFDEDDKLVIGKINKAQAKEKRIRDGVQFGPALVVNGEGSAVVGESGGLNPRTAIGQRADGAVLLLVIDGRQINSLGASMKDLIEIMLTYGAVNAANLDGGSSTIMYYEGEYVNEGFALVGSRNLPTCFIVK